MCLGLSCLMCSPLSRDTRTCLSAHYEDSQHAIHSAETAVDEPGNVASVLRLWKRSQPLARLHCGNLEHWAVGRIVSGLALL